MLKEGSRHDALGLGSSSTHLGKVRFSFKQFEKVFYIVIELAWVNMKQKVNPNQRFYPPFYFVHLSVHIYISRNISKSRMMMNTHLTLSLFI